MMLLRTLGLCLVLGLGAAALPLGDADAIEDDDAICYLDPDDPVPGVTCGVNQTVNCVKGIIKDKRCPV